jgi:hypothetical protein
VIRQLQLKNRPFFDDAMEAASEEPTCLDSNRFFLIGITVHDLLPKELKPDWPSLLGFAVGRSVQGLHRGNPSGGLYLALDVDLQKLPGDSPLPRKALLQIIRSYRSFHNGCNSYKVHRY